MRLTPHMSQVRVRPRFGFGGMDKTANTARPMPQPRQYRVRLRRKDLRLTPDNQIILTPRFVDMIYRQVFRSSLTQPGFVVLSNLGPMLNNDMKRIRAFQVKLGEAIADRRSQQLCLSEEGPFSLKYMGRSNKAKRNPLHCDTKSTDSVVLMMYEPAKNIRACPFFTDLTQFAQDQGRTPLDLISMDNPYATEKGNGYKVKSHYGHQIKAEHHDALLNGYTYDISDLDLNQLQLVVFNDSVGSDNLGLAHGMRKMEIPDPTAPTERNFNHVVFDVQNREVVRAQHQKVSAKQAPTYYEKGPLESEQTPVSYQTAVSQYVETGKIFYRNPLMG